MTKEEYKMRFKNMAMDYNVLILIMRDYYPDVYYSFFDDIQEIEEKLHELQFKLD